MLEFPDFFAQYKLAQILLIVLGIYHMRRGDLVGVRMQVDGIVPESDAIAFVPDQCYFGVERK